MRLIRSFSLLITLMLVGAPVVAQQEITVTGVGEGVVFNYPPRVYIGPYDVFMPGVPTLDVYCVDFVHNVTLGETYQANLTSIGGPVSDFQYGQTRWGQEYSAAGWSAEQIQTQYRAAAWLAGQFDPNDRGPGNIKWANLHAAIWQLFTPQNPGWYGGGAAIGAPQTLMGNAIAAASSGNVNFEGWHVVTDTELVNGMPKRQEFLTHISAVPEPATIFLMGTGLVAVMGMTVVMRQSIG